MSSQSNNDRSFLDISRLLYDIYGPAADASLEDPTLLAPILKAVTTSTTQVALEAHDPELWAKLQENPELRAALDLFSALETSTAGEQSPDQSTALPIFSHTVDRVRNAIAQGKQWVVDATGNLSLLFGASPQLSTNSAMLKSSAPKDADREQMLQQITVAEPDALGDWDITATVFAEGEATCRIEVSIFSSDLSTNLAGIAVIFQQDDEQIAQTTDENGHTLFTGIARNRLDEALLQVQLPSVPLPPD